MEVGELTEELQWSSSDRGLADRQRRCNFPMKFCREDKIPEEITPLFKRATELPNQLEFGSNKFLFHSSTAEKMCHGGSEYANVYRAREFCRVLELRRETGGLCRVMVLGQSCCTELFYSGKVSRWSFSVKMKHKTLPSTSCIFRVGGLFPRGGLAEKFPFSLSFCFDSEHEGPRGVSAMLGDWNFRRHADRFQV